MPREGRDPSYVFDMIDAARSVVDMTRGVAFDEFAGDRKLYRATEREIEIMGEAARRLSERTTAAHPEVPWGKIIGTRHRIAHEYDEIRLAIVYRIATVHVPELIRQLEAIQASMPPPPAAGPAEG